MLKVLFVVVHYCNSREIDSWLKMLELCPKPLGLEPMVAIWNNRGNLNVRSSMDVAVFGGGSNHGYLNGCRLAMEEWTTSNSERATPDRVVVCNTDLVLDRNFFFTLGALASEPDVGVIAPSIRTERGGTHQNPFLRSAPGWMYCIKWDILVSSECLYLVFATLSEHFKRKRQTAQPPVRSTIYAAHGCLFILEPSFFRSGCNLRFPHMMYGEELFIAEQVRQAGLRIVYEPALAAIHRQAGVTRFLKKREQFKFIRESWLGFRRNYR